MSSQDRAEIKGSGRGLPSGARREAALDGSHRLEVSVYLRRGDESGVVSDADAPALRREALARHRAGSQKAAIGAVEAFARAHGLEVAGVEPGRRLVRLRGTAAALGSAFGTTLHHCADARGARFVAHEGALSLPRDVAGHVESVLGLDTRPIATPKFVRAEAAGTSYLPNAVGRLYAFPASLDGSGQTIALIELGGGYEDGDTAAAFEAMGLAVPSVTSVSVDGATNSPGSDADGEVALDIQVAGGNAPGAKIVVYFAPNTDQGFADAISAAAHDTANAVTVMSISWGGPESSWSSQAVGTMNTQIEDAGRLGVSVFVASGDNLATDGVSDGAAHVDFPASSPYAIGCGGTRIASTANSITSEIVWNDGSSGTGGGFSALFDAPSFQSGVAAVTAKGKRGVPDVAGDASPSSGYVVELDGAKTVVGGTSAVAPLWAALTALLNQSHGKALGFFLSALYGDASAFRDITSGTNKPTDSTIGFDAGPGWDACTGLGSPDGARLLGTLFGTTPDVA